MDQAIEKITSVIKELGQKFGAGSFEPKVFVDTLEPVFGELGYRKAPHPKVPPHILVVRDDAAGDFVLFSPFLRELRRLYPTAHITLLTSQRNQDLAMCCPYVDNVLLNDLLEKVEGQPFRLEKMAELAKMLLPYHFDLAFMPRLGIKSMSLVTGYVSGARCRIGFTQDRNIYGQDKIVLTGWNVLLSEAVPFVDGFVSDVDRNLSLLEHMLQLPLARRDLELWYTEQDRAAAQEAIEPLSATTSKLLAVVPGASIKMKEWPLERYKEFIGSLLDADRGLGALVMGGPQEREIAEDLVASLGDRAISLAGKLSFRASAAAMSRVTCYVGNDTALMHFAAAQKKPILTVEPFPAELPTSPMAVPVRYQPYQVPAVVVLPPVAADKKCNELFGYGCARKDEHHCIAGVTVAKVRKGWNLLQQRIAAGENNVVIMK